MEGLILSQGLTARRIATTGRRVDYNSDGTEKSDIAFHWFPDAGATFADPRADNVGGWIYVSNSEVDATKVDFDIGEFPGGVGALTFNAAGAILEYQMVLDQTRMNCGGGRTPWHTWVSCEETTGGRIYHVDPTGRRAPEPVTLGDPDDTLAGKFESFAYDDRDRMQPRFFVTKDEEAGELRRLYVRPLYFYVVLLRVVLNAVLEFFGSTRFVVGLKAFF